MQVTRTLCVLMGCRRLGTVFRQPDPHHLGTRGSNSANSLERHTPKDSPSRLVWRLACKSFTSPCFVTDSNKGLKLTMLQKCANPGCSVAFRSLREGKLFVSEVVVNDFEVGFDGNRRKTRKREHFWLCGACSVHFTLHFDSTLGMLTVPIGERSTLQPPGLIPLPRAANGD
jgi:hypothetical protein